VSLRLYFDHHIPGAVATALRQRRIDVLTAQEDGAHQLEDPLLLDRASSLGRILVSQDRDLIIETARRLRSGKPFAGLIWGRHLSYTLRQTIEDLEILATLYTPDDMANRIEYLPL
jgi:predicted nuclease of predicted toxin-antitoxin system